MATGVIVVGTHRLHNYSRAHPEEVCPKTSRKRSVRFQSKTNAKAYAETIFNPSRSEASGCDADAKKS